MLRIDYVFENSRRIWDKHLRFFAHLGNICQNYGWNEYTMLNDCLRIDLYRLFRLIPNTIPLEIKIIRMTGNFQARAQQHTYKNTNLLWHIPVLTSLLPIRFITWKTIDRLLIITQPIKFNKIQIKINRQPIKFNSCQMNQLVDWMC